jgi:hypothetical protein
MSAVLEAPRPAVEAESTSSLLHDIISRVDAIGVAQQRPSPVRLRTWEEIERFAEKAARSGMVPKDYIGKPDAICIAVQMGSELGLAPMQAVQNIAVINGRPAIWGDALPALCRASPVCRSIREWHEGDGDAAIYYCEAVRKDDPTPVRGKFSVDNAKKAGLWGKSIWGQYPERMLQMRARGFALRDAFPDVLKGLMTVEEARDIPFAETGLTPTMPTPAEAARDKQAQAYSRRDEINREIPLTTKPAERTPDELLDAMEIAMRACDSLDEVNKLIANRHVQNMLRDFKNGHKARLDGIIASGIGAHAPVTHKADDSDGWPGPTPADFQRERETADA